MPKFFCKKKEHKVAKGGDSFFDNVTSFDDWDEPNYGFRQRLKDEVDSAESTIESTMNEDSELSDTGRALVTIALSTTVQLVDLLIRYIDQTYNQLIRSKYSKQKAWALVSRLIVRMFQDIFNPRTRKQKIMKSAHPTQVAITIFYSSLKSLKIMRYYKDQGIDKHMCILLE